MQNNWIKMQQGRIKPDIKKNAIMPLKMAKDLNKGL